jgi:glycosyltransferase involved in cell wall biosynthesis
VCVSDNCSTDETELVVRNAQADIAIKYHKNTKNLGIPKNFINVVDMAGGEFVWLIGDDDILLPNALEELDRLINQNGDVDFFYVNSFHLDAKYVSSFPQPFDTANLPKDMKPFSSWNESGKLMFMDLINPKISFDFLGGMFLSVFRRKNWLENVNVLDSDAIEDARTFSHFDNTFPHVKIFASAFAESRAYFNADPLNVCLTGVREWGPMYPLVHSVRLIESLDQYRRNGLPIVRYWQCKNFALNSFIPDLAKMYVTKDVSGIGYINPMNLIWRNCLYPNFYLSVFYFFARKLKLLLSR